ncbi:NADP-specific glutamate dehydrogenase [Methanobrevibacter sp. DSM 116169]|uniref:NADP-specific glutamate dehydrogenase n=1 Tax=Methanobrevibacter sp. DSM 116169 TaxID=3242727 RepID=UPI0038FCFB8F
MSYVDKVLEKIEEKNRGEPEFIQAATEILESLRPMFGLNPEYEKAALLERILIPERAIIFRVPWVDDEGKIRVHKGFRVQFNSAVGPYKGGIRFHPSVNLSVMKFLAFEQIFKNGLTGLSIGGAKGGSNFNPKGKSDNEIMSFCQSFMSELYKYIGPDTDVPAGDIGVGGREIGYLFGQYKKLTGIHAGVLTGAGLDFGGSYVRTEATGYGLGYIMDNALKARGESFEGKDVVISGSGNVAIYAAEKVEQLGGKVISMSDSSGYIHDPDGISLADVKQLKEVERKRISEYAELKPNAEFYCGCSDIWNLPCDVALPCATQNELDTKSAETLISNGVKYVGEGANMPTTLEATNKFLDAGIILLPGKAANAGGVATSALEMSQRSMRIPWTFEEVDKKLQDIMSGIYKNIDTAAAEHGFKDNYIRGANIAGFLKVSRAMMAQGVV